MSRVKDTYGEMLTDGAFLMDEQKSNPTKGSYCYTLNPEKGCGTFQLYFYKDMFSIEIHDFLFYKDYLVECPKLDFLSLHYYTSVSGEELHPYYQLMPNTLRAHIGGDDEILQMLYHKNVPIKSVSIAILPDYYNRYLKEKFEEEYINPLDAFRHITLETDFPELVSLLKQVQHYKGQGLAAKMFYEGKVLEVLSLIMERAKQNKQTKRRITITKQDEKNLKTVTSYIDNHYAFTIPQERLSLIAYMGSSKLKSLFKEYFGCSISEYVIQKRIGQAQHLLLGTDFSIGEIAKAVGYERSDSFSKQFQKNTGLLPREFKTMYKTNSNRKSKDTDY